VKGPLQRLFDVRRGEIAIVTGCCLFFFCLLACNYVWRPLREEIGIRGGPEDLPWLYTGTLIATLILSPLFAWLVSRTERKRFITWTYRFFALSLVVFYFWLSNSGVKQSTAGYAFYIWISAFNLLLISVFWGFLSDIFRNDQAKRVYGLIGAGGTLGGVAGSGLMKWVMGLSNHPDPLTLLLCAALVLEICVQCMHWVGRRAPANPTPAHIKEPVKPDALTGLRLVASQPYLRVLCLYMVLQTICATFLYNQRGHIVDAEIPDRVERVRFFANIDLWINGITLFVQIFLTSKLFERFGVALMLLPLPLIAIGGFTSLAFSGSLFTIQVAFILSRSCEFATAKPARETLYTVVSRAEKYQAKSFIDTFVYRGGDLIGAWGHMGLMVLAQTIPSLAAVLVTADRENSAYKVVAAIAVPIAIAFGITAWTLGRRQEALVKASRAMESKEGPV